MYGSKRKNGGRYEIRFTESAAHGHRLRIEAEGYAPAISRPIADDAGDAKVDFELIAGRSIAGVVRLPGGQAAGGGRRGAGCPVATGLHQQRPAADRP